MSQKMTTRNVFCSLFFFRVINPKVKKFVKTLKKLARLKGAVKNTISEGGLYFLERGLPLNPPATIASHETIVSNILTLETLVVTIFRCHGLKYTLLHMVQFLSLISNLT